METIKIGNYDVSKDDAWLYVQHFGRDKSNLNAWEQMRQSFHNYIFENLGLDRFSVEGQEFGKSFDEWAEPHILRYDPIAAKAKALTNAKTENEIKYATMDLQVEMKKQEFKDKHGARDFDINDSNVCRVCNKELKGGRINDHLMQPTGFDKINAPICSDCSKERPDDYHTAFKDQYGNKISR